MFFRELEAYLEVLGESFLGIVGESFLDLCGYFLHLLQRITFYHSSVSLSITFLQFKWAIYTEKLAFYEDTYPIAK